MQADEACFVEALLSRPRLRPYLDEAQGDRTGAVDLYRWNQRMIGVVLKHCSDVEIAVRNACDVALVRVCPFLYHMDDWIGADQGSTPDEIYDVLRKNIQEARHHAVREATHRARGHPRFGQSVTRDDVLAQLTFGTWDILLGSGLPRNARCEIQQRLWESGLSQAFPNVRQDDQGRYETASRLKRVRTLRNRAAHAENLLHADLSNRLKDMLSILSAMDSRYAAWSMQGSKYRTVLRQRPVTRKGT